jgi:CheY-like chemotaxis protein
MEATGLLKGFKHLSNALGGKTGQLAGQTGDPVINWRHFRLIPLYDQIRARFKAITSARGMRLRSSYDTSLPQVVQGDENLLIRAISPVFDKVLLNTGVGYVSFAVRWVKKGVSSYIAFVSWYTGVDQESADEEPLEPVPIESEAEPPADNWSDLKAVKKILKLIGGKITMDVTIDGDSVYTVWIPLFPGDSALVERTPARPLALAKAGVKALVVDDYAISRTVITQLLLSHNIKTEIAQDGREAFKMLKTGNYDLVFMDYLMPKMDGTETTALIRAQGDEYFQNIPIIGLSSSLGIGGEAETAFLKAGMSDYMAKPADPVKLNDILLTWLPPDKRAAQTSEATAKAFGKAAPDHSPAPPPLSGLPILEGLNHSAGLANVNGNREIYDRLLRQFSTEMEENVRSLLALLAQEQWKKAIIYFHSLRSFLSTIGAEAMAKEALVLEIAMKNGQGHENLKRIGVFCDDLIKFRAALVGRISVKPRAEIKAKRRMTPENLKGQLKKLYEACMFCRSTEVDTLLEDLIQQDLSNEAANLISEICSLVKTFDYEKALEQCDVLLNQLAASEKV